MKKTRPKSFIKTPFAVVVMIIVCILLQLHDVRIPAKLNVYYLNIQIIYFFRVSKNISEKKIVENVYTLEFERT